MSGTHRVSGCIFQFRFGYDRSDSPLIKALMKSLGERVRSLSSFSGALGDFAARRPPRAFEDGWPIVQRELILLRAINHPPKARLCTRIRYCSPTACPLIKSYLNRKLCFPATRFLAANRPRRNFTLAIFLPVVSHSFPDLPRQRIHPFAILGTSQGGREDEASCIENSL